MAIRLLEVDKNPGTSLETESGRCVLCSVLKSHMTSIKLFPFSVSQSAKGGVSSTARFSTLKSVDDGRYLGRTYDFNFKCAHPLIDSLESILEKYTHQCTQDIRTGCSLQHSEKWWPKCPPWQDCLDKAWRTYSLEGSTARKKSMRKVCK